jgi:catechol 2,3-dioxygenase-like lactoylglutathione lyase family enzyme
MNLNQVTLPSIDIEASIGFYQQLGLTLIVRSPHYARLECPDGDATLSVHLADGSGAHSGVVVYFECDDLDDRVGKLQARGIAFTSPPTDERWLWREARLADPSGNVICLFRAGEHRRHPPWRVPAGV